MPDAPPAAILPIFGLEDRLRICWLAYPETRLLNHGIGIKKLRH